MIQISTFFYRSSEFFTTQAYLLLSGGETFLTAFPKYPWWGWRAGYEDFFRGLSDVLPQLCQPKLALQLLLLLKQKKNVFPLLHLSDRSVR